ncbi:spore cortex biosynthesis protein YabQ [Oceanobacillus sp. J11TS1]|uniref:spore cortex biosynthesis protein YabQ n=1 Tax=Oceanobacillus sp. J11TS1 TaxID=2807191 RepID=UPI001B221EC2|nr:spore cortex biosynthesis protein YabQ [Oceanobacillus sp. J11TS1]GIO24235.1 spore protein YabQ [Oceanobacillus sp. J11TS1]
MTLSTQFITLITMIISGFYLGIVQETFRRFTIYWKGRLFLTYSLEILFWVTQAGILFYILYRVNQGELRLYIVLACLFGFSIYQALVKQAYKRLLEHVIQILRAIYQGIEKLIKILLISPLRWIILTLYRMIKAILIGILKIVMWIFRFVFTPFRWVGTGIFRLLPKPIQKLFLQIAGFYSKIQNIVNKWLQSYRRR